MKTDGQQASSPEQAKSRRKEVALKSEKIPQIFRRLSATGFKHTPDGRYVNSDPAANIREIRWGLDTIEENCALVIVTARKPFAYAAAAIERFAQPRQAELERKLR